MLYATKDAGSAIGEIVAGLSEHYDISGVEIKLTQDSLTTILNITPDKSRRPVKIVKTGKSGKPTNRKSYNKSKYAKNGMVECNGECLSIKEWAKKLGISDQGVRYRISKHGNPYGLKSPTDRDKVIAGA